MKKVIYLPLFLMLICSGLFAQKLQNQVISTAGSSAMNGINLLDWTVGEPFIAYYNQGVQLHQGFHQVIVTRIQSSIFDIKDKQEISVYPNPTTSFVTLTSDYDLSDAQLKIITINGQIVYQNTFQGKAHQLDVSSFADGLYFIQLSNNKKTLTYKLIKSSN